MSALDHAEDYDVLFLDDSTFNPQNISTRAQAATVFVRLLEVLE